MDKTPGENQDSLYPITIKASLEALLEQVYLYPLTYPILERYAAIHRQLRPLYSKGLVDDLDTLIAVTALERNLTILNYRSGL